MTKKLLVLGGVVILVGVVVLLLVPGSGVKAPGEGSELLSSSTTETATSSSGTVPIKNSAKPGAKGSVVSSNRIILPLSGERWVTKENHTIQWSLAALGNGLISLIDAKTGSVVGVISPSLAVGQKTYTWNAQDVLVDRNGGHKKTIEPGEYLIRVTFEIGRKETIQSGQFSVIYANQKIVSSQTFTIQNYTMSPAKLTVKKGDIIYIRNNDPVSVELSMSNFSPITVGAGQTIVFQTNALTAGSYDFYSKQYSGLKGGIVVTQ